MLLYSCPLAVDLDCLMKQVLNSREFLPCLVHWNYGCWTCLYTSWLFWGARQFRRQEASLNWTAVVQVLS